MDILKTWQKEQLLIKRIAPMFYNFFNKKTAGSGIKYIPQNEQLTEELHQPIIRKFKKNSAFKE